MPWLPSAEDQGHAGFTWSWLGAALQASALTFGTVTAPGHRYHPVILAQAIATLAEMYPSRLWVAVATGEALNEHVIDAPWDPKPARRERLRECVDIMRALLRGETVSHRGHVRVRDAKLYSRPAEVPLLFGAALTVETARWAGAWADGLITVAAEPAALRRVIEAFREHGGANKPIFVQAAVAYASTEARARELARTWRQAGIEDSEAKGDLPTPEAFAARSEQVTLEMLRRAVRISDSVEQHVAWTAADFEAGADRVYVHAVGADQEAFLGDVAPALLRL